MAFTTGARISAGRGRLNVSLSEKRYIGQRIGAGVFATTDDVDHGFVDAPLLTNGIYKAVQLGNGTYGVGPCHHPVINPFKKVGVRLNSQIVGATKCAVQGGPFRADLFTPGAEVLGMGSWAIYSKEFWFPNAPNVMTKTTDSDGSWPEELEFTPAGGTARGGWRRQWPGQIEPDWQVMVSGVADSLANGTHTFKCGVNHPTLPDYYPASSLFDSGMYSVYGTNPSGDAYHFFNRISKFPTAYAMGRVYPISPPALFVYLHNSWGDVARYSKQGPYGETTLNLVTDDPNMRLDQWPSTITLTEPFQDANDPLTFTLSGFDDEAMNTTWNLYFRDEAIFAFPTNEVRLWTASNPCLLGVLYNNPP